MSLPQYWNGELLPAVRERKRSMADMSAFYRDMVIKPDGFYWKDRDDDRIVYVPVHVIERSNFAHNKTFEEKVLEFFSSPIVEWWAEWNYEEYVQWLMENAALEELPL